MKLVKFILIFAISPLLMTGQVLTGTYKSGGEYIRFSNDTVTFLFQTGGCLVYRYEATGKFTLDNKHLIIYPLIDTPLENITKTKRYIDDSVSIEVVTPDNELTFPSLTVYDDKKKVISGRSVTPNKKENLRNSAALIADSVRIADINYITLGFKIDKGFDYKVALQKGKIKSDYEQFLNSNGNGFRWVFR